MIQCQNISSHQISQNSWNNCKLIRLENYCSVTFFVLFWSIKYCFLITCALDNPRLFLGRVPVSDPIMLFFYVLSMVWLSCSYRVVAREWTGSNNASKQTYLPLSLWDISVWNCKVKGTYFFNLNLPPRIFCPSCPRHS